jgi:hypothetical protein
MVHIVGAGLAGSITKRVLDNAGIKSTIYDCENPWRASVISENLFSPSWANTLGDTVVSNGIKTLESIVPIKTISFKTKAGYSDVLHIHPKEILVEYTKKQIRDLDLLKGIVIDCRGFWASAINMEGLTGQGLFIKGKMARPPVMNFVAPYVHQKLFQWDKNKIWYGDSTCIRFNKYIDDKDFYVSRCIQRAKNLLQENFQFTVEHGIRPYANKQKGYLTLGKKHIVNTGGWKCGLIIYADHAQKILKHIEKL